MPLLEAANAITVHARPPISLSGSPPFVKWPRPLSQTSSWPSFASAQKFDGSRHGLYPGRPPIGRQIAELIVRVAHRNSGWGYDCIAGVLSTRRMNIFDLTGTR